jgi:PPM family protein phosphatase
MGSGNDNEDISVSVVVGAASDVGRARANNEDSFLVLLPPRLEPRLDALIVVADGMGGHQAGEQASRIIVDHFADEFTRSDDRTLGADWRVDWARDLERVIHEANTAVIATAATDPRLLGMGSTVVAGIIKSNRLYLSNVGDSRAYLINDPTIYQLSQDHSWVAEQVRLGAITASDARHHPRRNVLTRAVGSMADVDVDLWALELVPGDQILLCTDGLTNVVSDKELVEVAGSHAPQDAARALIDLANQRGAPDNVTVVIAQFQDS